MDYNLFCTHDSEAVRKASNFNSIPRRKGVGKNALVDRIGGLLSHDNYLVTHDGRYLMSSFNGHMESCLCMVFDEAFWSGDKSAEGKLKGLITSPEVLIERKGKEAYKADNLVGTIIIGNESWLVPHL